MPHKTIFNWSGGKDSALALHHILQNPKYDVQRLLTSVNGVHKRISMHGVRETLLEKQAESIGISIQKLLLPEQPGMEEYNKLMGDIMSSLCAEGFTHSVFGDIFLEDLRKYRENRLAEQGFMAVFPLWKKNTTELVHEFIDLGFKTIVVCVKSELLDKSFAGRVIDRDFLTDLPKNVDPCGENGEFHTFVFDGPIFNKTIAFEIGEKVFKEYKMPKHENDNCFSNKSNNKGQMGFWFCDLVEYKND